MKTGANCTDPAFYRAAYPGLQPGEAAALHLAFYYEKELQPDSAEQTAKHVRNCAGCQAILQDLEKDDLNQTADVVSAVCPSSESIDLYLFQRQVLSVEVTQKLELHFQRCELCREEMQWLSDLESNRKTIKPRAHSRTWVQSVVAAAAALFLAISALLFWQASRTSLPEDQLRSLAVIKSPDQIDYDELFRSSNKLSQDANAIFEEGLAAFKAGDFQEASLRFEKLKAHAPDHSASLYLLGYSYYKLNRAQEAFQLCDEAEKIRPHSYERCMFLVNLALKTGHFDRARTEIATLYHEAPEVPEISTLYHRIMDLTQKRKIRL